MACGGFRIGPDAGQAGDAFGFDGEVGAGADQDFFEEADEIYCAQRFSKREIGTSLRLVPADEGVRRSPCITAEIEYGIADQLAGTVEGYVAAATASELCDAAPGEEFGRDD